ncbi:MAG TPA: outer membrane lipoprotein carrier protein LolA [Thermoanaerobaculia bacterium]|nr:outer membrane lipoprotein carrier protein LolA [Thermoanaerobaculia bacterium]
MSLKRWLSVAICAAAAATPLLAAVDPNSLDEVIRKVQLQQKNTSTLEADFRQEKTLALLAKPEVSTGHFTYSKPNNVFWHYDAPKRVDMLIANGMLTTYYPDLNKAEQIEVKRYQDRIFKYMGASGAIDELATYFDFTFTNRADEPSYVLDLQPKTKSIAKRVRHIKIWIDKKSYLTTKFEYTEGDGDQTRYEFTHVRVNQPIEQGRFTLNLPKSVRVEQIKLQ